MPKSTTSPKTSPTFTFFEGLRTESTATPQVTVRRNGLMVLSRGAVDLLEAGSTHVRVGFDEKTGTVGLKGTNGDAKGSYKLRSQKHGASRTADGRRFFAHLGMTFDKAQTFPAEDFGDGVVGFRFPVSK